MNKINLSVVLGSYNRKKYLKYTIKTLRQELARCDFPSEIIVVDGGSNDGAVKWLAKQKDIITIIQHNRGKWQGQQIKQRSWGYFMNLAFKCAKGKYICMISDDCLVIPNAIKNGYQLFESELERGNKIGAVAFYWRNWPNQIKYHVNLTLNNKMQVNHGMYLKSVLEEINYIDEKTYSFYHADGDLSLKIWQAGYEIIASPNSYIEHHAHINKKVRTANLEKQKQDWRAYLNKWQGIFYDEQKYNIGGLIEKEYDDPNKLAKKFF